jgi:hypothetical protein
MKKFLAAILAIVYLTVSSGATINLHYCMGKLMSWDLSAKNKNTCGTCGMEKAGQKGCCHDEHKQLKAEKDQKISEPVFQFLSINKVVSYPLSVDFALRFSSLQASDDWCVHAPPVLAAVPVYLSNRNFRI